MAGPVPAIHVLKRDEDQDVDARDKRGHDEFVAMAVAQVAPDRGRSRPDVIALQQAGEVNLARGERFSRTSSSARFA